MQRCEGVAKGVHRLATRSPQSKVAGEVVLCMDFSYQIMPATLSPWDELVNAERDVIEHNTDL